MQTAFRALLTSASAVTARVPASRLVWGLLPQGSALPNVALHLIGHAPGLTLAGSDGFWRGRVQVDCHGDTLKDAKAVADAITATLHGHSGGGFQMIALDGSRDLTETSAAGVPVRLSLDFLTIWSN